MTIRTHLAEVCDILDLLEEHAVQATAIADNSPPAKVRPHFASLAAGIARARLQLTFVMNLLPVEESPDAEERPN